MKGALRSEEKRKRRTLLIQCTCRDGKRQLFLAEVLTGDVQIKHASDSSIKLPDVNPKTNNHYDSIEGETENTIIYITYVDFRAYPTYLLTYTV